MKKYLKDMSVEEQVGIIMNNNKLKEQCESAYYDDLMEQQLENGKLMLGKEHWRYIDIRDNYSSFYLVLKDWNKFIDNLDSDYLCNKGIDLYNEIIKLKDKYENEEMYSDNYYKLEELLEEKCKELLDICEQQLHEYETYNDEDLRENIKFNIEENYYGEDLYIIDDDKTKVYEDIAYTKTYE